MPCNYHSQIKIAHPNLDFIKPAISLLPMLFVETLLNEMRLLYALA